MTNFSKLHSRILRGSTALSAVAMLGGALTATAFVAAPAAAQDLASASISGNVVDEAGTPVAGAQVQVYSPTRGITRTATTSAGGTFNVSQIPSGQYVVTITADGFSDTRIPDVGAALGGASYNFALTRATDTGTEIVVTGRAVPRIDFSGTATGIVVDVQEVAERVPVPRNIESIQLLAPQTTSGDSAFGGVSISGSSVAENIYYVNGMNITNFRTFVGGTTVPFEFYDQVQVKTGGYQAEFGRNTGGAVIALTRSGANTMDGGMNVYWQPDGLRNDSPDTYAQNNSLDERESIEGNIWLSGPIIKDRLFFFAFVNPRHDYAKDVSASGVVTESTINDPFYGGKIDLNLFDGHRIEATYFNDTQNEDVLTDGERTTNYAGGENYILRYTGQFTDWLTVSGLYGKSKFNQTSEGAADAIPYVLDGRDTSQGLVYIAGNPAGLIETGDDTRENYRVDFDVNFSLLGSHRVRFGGDYEKLTADNVSLYSGGVYYRYYRTGGSPVTLTTQTASTVIPANTDYIRVRNLQSGGSFDSENTAFYIQDDWDVNDRLNLSLGLRYDRFKNLNAEGEAFTDLDNQFAPRLGVNYDVFGDDRTRLSAFYGRYYLPVAANTNIRLAGAELFTEDYYLLNSANYTGDLTDPVLGASLGTNILGDGTVAPASALVSKNLKPQYLDEFIIGGEHRFGNGWTVGINGTYRKLGAVLEDVDFDGSGSYESIIEDYCATQTLDFCNATTTPGIGGSGYVLLNPGEDLIVDVVDDNGDLRELTMPNSFIGLPKAEREYYSVELKFEKAFNGTYGFNGSYVWSESKGNYEGGVKSDNGQDDTGLTQDFDELGWTDGAYGYLPNHRRHTFKLWGSFAPTDNIILGANALLQSPRKFGCQGTYPLGDGRATGTLASSWYCDAQIQAGNIEGTVGQPVGRGTVFDSDWNKRVDISAQIRLPLGSLEGLTLRADVFNVFNFKSKLDFNEFGDLDNAAVINPNYRKVTGYQTPRFVRLSAAVAF